MLAEYLPTLLFLIVATGIGIALIVVGNVLGPKRPSAEKLSPYECGFSAFENARGQFVPLVVIPGQHHLGQRRADHLRELGGPEQLHGRFVDG